MKKWEPIRKSRGQMAVVQKKQKAERERKGANRYGMEQTSLKLCLRQEYKDLLMD